MKLNFETAKGWTEAILDDNCGCDKFYKASGLLESVFHCVFVKKIDDFDSLYWDFEYQGSPLTLHYNTFMGVSLFPTRFKEATASDNERVEGLGSLLFFQLLDQDWYDFDKGKTIGKKGSEDGIILTDLENIHGARITVEQIGDPSPRFAITFGIYGLLFHTQFKQGQDEVERTIAWLKSTINKVFDMYEQAESSRTDDWYHEHDRLVHELTID